MVKFRYAAKTDFVSASYKKYGQELKALTFKLQDVFHRMQKSGYLACFGDVEGEILYLLIREIQPEIVAEISPAAGWSTNYILAALTANQKGRLHSFEIKSKIGGRRTEDVILKNQHDDWDKSRLTIHIGDVRKTISEIQTEIHFLLLDSCHEAWFADWYLAELLPKVSGSVMIQDIAFVDELENSGEARSVWSWLNQNKVSFTSVGAVEEFIEQSGIRRAFAERAGFRSNAIFLEWPSEENQEAGFGLNRNRFNAISAAISENDTQEARSMLNELEYDYLRQPTRALKHRLFVKMAQFYGQLSLRAESERCYERALAFAFQFDKTGRPARLIELLSVYFKRRQLKLFFQTASLILFEPTAWRPLALAILEWPKRRLDAILRKDKKG